MTKKSSGELYVSVERLIYKLCWSVSKNSNEFDEFLSIGNEAYIRAYDTFDSSISKFSTWVYNCVRNALTNELIKRGRGIRYITNGENDCADTLNDVGLFFRGLSQDALDVVELVVDTKRDVLLLSNRKDSFQILRKYFSRAGWTASRVTEAFSEVRRFVNR